MLYCAKGGGGKLLTDKEYCDFVLRFEFKMPAEGSNNGLGIRAPREGDAAYQGMELQIIDEAAALSGKWGKLKDAQYHGSVYGVVAAKRGAMKPAGEWNVQEVTAKGKKITVVLNGQTILDTDLSARHRSGGAQGASGRAPHQRPHRLPGPQRLRGVPQHPHQGTQVAATAGHSCS